MDAAQAADDVLRQREGEDLGAPAELERTSSALSAHVREVSLKKV
jgi:hypothetical protein